MKVKILFLSISGTAYDTEEYYKLSEMSYDQVLNWADMDKTYCFSIRECDVDLSTPNEFNDYCDGITVGDNGDTMFVYVNVEGK